MDHFANLQSSDWQVRWRAAEELAKLAEQGDGRALEALATVRDDPYWEVRHAAVRAWAKAEDGRRQAFLLEALADRMYWIGQAAIEGLIRFGVAAVEPLIEVLGDGRPEVSVRAAEALGRLGDPRALPMLRTLASDRRQPGDVRKAAQEASTRIEEAWSAVSHGAIEMAGEKAVSEGAIAVVEGENGEWKMENGGREAGGGGGWKRGRKPWWQWLLRL